MTTVTASECVCVGVKPRANKEGGKSEKERERERGERCTVNVAHILWISQSLIEHQEI